MAEPLDLDAMERACRAVIACSPAMVLALIEEARRLQALRSPMVREPEAEAVWRVCHLIKEGGCRPISPRTGRVSR